nr:hypothetical protein CFP56_07877 [Quercus suber]
MIKPVFVTTHGQDFVDTMDPISLTAGLISVAISARDMISSLSNMRPDTQMLHLLAIEISELRRQYLAGLQGVTDQAPRHIAGMGKQFWIDAICINPKGEPRDTGGGWMDGEQSIFQHDGFAPRPSPTSTWGYVVQASRRAIRGHSKHDHDFRHDPWHGDKDLSRHMRKHHGAYYEILFPPQSRIAFETYSRIARAVSIIKVLLLISMACAMAIMFQYGAAQRILHPEMESSSLLRFLQGWQISFPSFLGHGAVPSSALFLAATIVGPLSMAAFYEANQNDQYQSSILVVSAMVATGVTFTTPISALGGLICVFPKALLIGLLLSDIIHARSRERHKPNQERILYSKSSREPVCDEKDVSSLRDHEATLA